ncbi:MAG: HypC/HybG/HupF family hydrogenase formation chaperone [Spirochaetia bacterium]|jgi:hydrogenase expression/formation protein HypC|nr:HypC/HybG/HupF family hydrogenase formation chaperone [Spirochaetia bacterium]
MCLSIPAEVLSINGDMAEVSVGGTKYNANIELVENVNIGDFILIHSGYGIAKIDEAEAMDTLNLMQEIKKKAGRK